MASQRASPDPIRRLAHVLKREVPSWTPAMSQRSWNELGVDSFGLLVVRAALEEALGRPIDDAVWIGMKGPADVMALDCSPARRAPSLDLVLAATVELGMPQMAARGLSEGWLFRRLGDMHWQLVAQALRTRASDIVDGEGRRLYAAFNRVRMSSNVPLGDYCEGERLVIDTHLSRFGAGLFFSEASFAGEEGRSGTAKLMSSFTYREPGGFSNALRRGQPVLAAKSRALSLAALPEFGVAYQTERARSDAPRPAVRSVSYEVVPQHDINGVGLLYFAAYPVIADICESHGQPRGGVDDIGRTRVRDIFYFANADAGGGIEWRLHEEQSGTSEASLVRDDGVVMALIRTEKDVS